MMNQEIANILKSTYTNAAKLKKLDELIEDINIAKDIVNGKYKYCPKCEDYYLAKSFITNEEIIKEKICIYKDPINSGGNDYALGSVKYTTTICPKGHEVKVERRELEVGEI